MTDTPFGHEYGEGPKIDSVTKALRRTKIQILREQIWEHETALSRLRKEFSDLVLEQEGVKKGDVFEERDSGLWYVVERATAECQPFPRSQKEVHLVCHRLYKSGRRIGRQARSPTYLWLTERLLKIGTLQPDGTVLSLVASEAGAST